MTPLDTLSDAELMALAAGGSEPAFETIYHRQRAGLYRYALHMTGSKPLAEDILQEVFLALIGKLTAYDSGRGSLAAYLIGITRKHLLRHFERGDKPLPLETEAGDAPRATPRSLIEPRDPFAELHNHETVAALRSAILALPPRYREAVVLCDLEEMSYEEAAAAAGCAVGTIRSRLHRARTLLARKLRGPEPAPGPTASMKANRCLA